jgi:Holliday junction resolvasome RuvABC endonuclease subunit
MNYTGIDTGLTMTAIVSMNEKAEITSQTQFGYSHTEALRGSRTFHPSKRYGIYAALLKAYCDKFQDTMGTIMIEQPMGLFAGNAVKLAELYGAYLVTLGNYFSSEKIVILKPTKVKQLFTGDGGATKDIMIHRCRMLGYKPANHHIADAIGMAYIGVKDLRTARDKLSWTQK